MGAYRGRREFRAGAGAIVVSVLVTILFGVGAVMTYRDRGWNWVSIGLACATVFGVAAIVEALVLRIQLTDDALVVTDLRGRRFYPVADIAGVEEAKGSPTMLLLASGRVVRLPPVGSSLGNSIRGWLKHSARSTGLLIGVALLLGACTYWEPHPSPVPGARSPRLPSSLRVASDTGAPLLLVEPFIRADTLVGRVGRDTVRVPIEQLRGIQRQRVDGLRTLGLIAGVSAVWMVAGFYGGGLK
jgi:hypothetical protein